jgi:hypothetical protein
VIISLKYVMNAIVPFETHFLLKLYVPIVEISTWIFHVSVYSSCTFTCLCTLCYTFIYRCILLVSLYSVVSFSTSSLCPFSSVLVDIYCSITFEFTPRRDTLFCYLLVQSLSGRKRPRESCSSQNLLQKSSPRKNLLYYAPNPRKSQEVLEKF